FDLLYYLFLLCLSFFSLLSSIPLLPTLLYSFPTRRSSDLMSHQIQNQYFYLYIVPDHCKSLYSLSFHPIYSSSQVKILRNIVLKDRKSTRLNSSHVSISYAVFCLKKKNINSSVNIILYD